MCESKERCHERIISASAPSLTPHITGFSTSSPLLPSSFYPSPATFHSLDSHRMENSWFGDCPEHYAQFFFESPIYLSCPVSSLAPCPHLGGATQLKQKKNSFYENMFLAHIWYCAASPPFLHFVSQHDSPVIHWCCAEFCI